MRWYIGVICLISLLFISFDCCAQPDFSNASKWAAFFNDDKASALPPGTPIDKGLVSPWYDKSTYRNTDYLHVYAPYDMSSEKYITLSNYAKDYRMVYTGKTVKSFLEATAEQMRNLAPDVQTMLPVFSLIADLPMPIKRSDKNTLGAVMGVYLVKGGKTVAFPNVRISSDGVQDSDDPNTRMKSYNEEGFNYYQFLEYYSGRRLMPARNRREAPYRLSEDNSPINSRRERVLSVIRGDWSDVNKLADERSIENVRLPNQIDTSTPIPPDNTEALNALENNMERRRTISNPHYVRRSSYNESPEPDFLNVDEKATWFLIEAMLTQTQAAVVEIHMPWTLEENLIDKAKRMGRPRSIIQKFKNIHHDDEYSSGIRVLLACSVRERFLGCPLGGVIRIEEEVSKQCDKLVKVINHAKSLDDKLRGLRLIIDANPIYLREQLATDDIKKEIEKNLSNKPQQEALHTLSLVDNIPIKKGNSLYIHDIEVPQDLQEDLETDRTDRDKDERPKRKIRGDNRPKDSMIDLQF